MTQPTTTEPDLTEAMEVAGWQRRRMYALPSEPPGIQFQWEQCSWAEANNPFTRQAGYEYRPVYSARVIATALEARDAEIARLKQAIKTQAAAVRTLHHHEGSEINILRAKQTEAHRAVVTLDSEREANAILTEELAERDARIAELREALGDARRIIAEIDDYMKRPERGDWGVECALCMGELLDDDRAAIARIDAILTKQEPKA